MAGAGDRRWNRLGFVIELFAILNLGFLTFDIYLAHSANQFRNPAEYIPLFFSAVAPIILIVALIEWTRHRKVSKILGYIAAWAAVVVGIAGVIFHLESSFFFERTLRSLTYSAPFAAPLAYTGLGLLLIMNRMVDPESIDWGQWILLFTLGGFLGNFVFSFSDHAENGFFFRVEWAPVIASAFAVGFLSVPLVMRVSRVFIDLCAVVLVLEAAVGLWGFVLHAAGNLQGPSIHPFDNFINGAPPLAPLLFPNLALLGLIGVWRLRTSDSYFVSVALN